MVASGKLYLFGGNPVGMTGTPPGAVWEYDAAGDKVDEEEEHAARRASRGGGGERRQDLRVRRRRAEAGWRRQLRAGEQRVGIRPGHGRVEGAGRDADGQACSRRRDGRRQDLLRHGGATNYRNRDGQSLEPNQPHRVLDVNEVYDPATNTWAAKQILPTPRNSMFTGVVNGKIYLIGGRVATAFATTGSVTDIVEEYDPATDKWGFLKDRMPTPRDEGVAGVLQQPHLRGRRRERHGAEQLRVTRV